jgi:predicted nucleic acid-binding protein
MKLFVDQSAWLAIFDPKTEPQKAVYNVFEESLANDVKILTHNVAIGLALSDIKKTHGHLLANKFYETIEAAHTGAHMSILWVGRRTQKDAVWLMRKHSNLDLDLYDFASYVLMKRRRLHNILTTKQDFKELNVTVLPEL